MLKLSEIEEGVVAYFDPSIIEHGQHHVDGTLPRRNGPYLCVWVWEGRSYWHPLTSKDSDHYRIQLLPPDWESCFGMLCSSWVSVTTTVSGPHQTFVKASGGQEWFSNKRPKLKQQTLMLLREMKKMKKDA